VLFGTLPLGTPSVDFLLRNGILELPDGELSSPPPPPSTRDQPEGLFFIRKSMLPELPEEIWMKILTEAAVQERKDWSLYLSLVVEKEYNDDELATCMFDDIFGGEHSHPIPSLSLNVG